MTVSEVCHPSLVAYNKSTPMNDKATVGDPADPSLTSSRIIHVGRVAQQAERTFPFQRHLRA